MKTYISGWQSDQATLFVRRKDVSGTKLQSRKYHLIGKDRQEMRNILGAAVLELNPDGAPSKVDLDELGSAD